MDTAPHCCRAEQQYLRVRKLLSSGSAVGDVTDESTMALHLAAEQGKASIIDLLIANRADCRAVLSVLHCGVIGKDVDIVTTLLKNDCMVSVSDRMLEGSRYVTQMAIRSSNTELARALFRAKTA